MVVFHFISPLSDCTGCVVSFPPCFFYRIPSIWPALFSTPSPPALIMPYFAPLPCSPFLCPLTVSLAEVQGAKVEEEIDSKKDSHVMWRGTKEDPGGLERLSTTPFIPRSSTPHVSPTLQAPTQRNNTGTLLQKLSTFVLVIMLFVFTFSCSTCSKIRPV